MPPAALHPASGQGQKGGISKRAFPGGNRLGNALGLGAWQQTALERFWQGFAV